MSNINKINVGGVDFGIDATVDASNVSFNKGESDLVSTNANAAILEVNEKTDEISDQLTDKIGGQLTNYTSVEDLAYDATNKKIMLKVAGADTPIPFSSLGAKYIGIFSSTTTIDVSNLGATSANQFIVETHNAASASNGNTDRMLDIAFYQASLSFSNGRLTVYPASFAATQYSKWGSDPRSMVYASVSGTIPTKVYYVGSVT